MPLASRSSAISPFTDCDRMREAAVTAASAAAARTAASACASASAILLSAVLVRRGGETFLLGLGLGRDAFGICLGGSNDVLRLALRAGLAGLVFRQQFRRLFLQPAGVVEFGLDALAAMIERLQYGAVDADIGEDAHQDKEGDGDPEFRFGEHVVIPSRTRRPRFPPTCRRGPGRRAAARSRRPPRWQCRGHCSSPSRVSRRWFFRLLRVSPRAALPASFVWRPT